MSRHKHQHLRPVAERTSDPEFDGPDLRGLGEDPILQEFRPESELRFQTKNGDSESLIRGFAKELGIDVQSSGGSEMITICHKSGWTHLQQHVYLFLFYLNLVEKDLVVGGSIINKTPSFRLNSDSKVKNFPNSRPIQSGQLLVDQVVRLALHEAGVTSGGSELPFTHSELKVLQKKLRSFEGSKNQRKVS